MNYQWNVKAFVYAILQVRVADLLFIERVHRSYKCSFFEKILFFLVSLCCDCSTLQLNMISCQRTLGEKILYKEKTVDSSTHIENDIFKHFLLIPINTKWKTKAAETATALPK